MGHFGKIWRILENIYISFKMLDQKALEEFNDIYLYLKRHNHQRCRNIRTTFSMASQFTHLFWLYLSVENRIALKRNEISSEQIVQCDEQYNVYNVFLKFIWCDEMKFTPRVLLFFHMTWRHYKKAVQEVVPYIFTHPNYEAYIMIRSD